MTYKARFSVFFAAMALFHLASCFAHPVTPTIIKELALHDYMFGVALAVMKCSEFLMSPFWGKANSSLSSRTSLLVCCCGYGAAQLLFAFSETEFSIICARLLAGIFVGGIFVSFLTYVVNTAHPEDQGRFLTYSATVASVFGPFGYLVGGLIGEFSVRAAFLLQAFCLIAAGILFRLVCLPDRDPTLQRPTFRQLASGSGPFRAFRDCGKFMSLSFALLFGISVLLNFGNTGFDQAFNFYLKDQLHLTSSYNGLIKACVGFVSFISNMTLCLWIIRKTNIKKSLFWLLLACTGTACGLLVSRGMILFIGWSVLLFALYSVSLPVLQNMIALRADPGQKNLVMGFYNATRSMGGIAGSLTAGFIYSIHAKLPFACTALIYALAVLTALGYLMRDRFCAR